MPGNPLTKTFSLGLAAALCASCADDTSVQWGPLLRQSGLFLGIQHGFRLATEPGTRAGMRGPFFRGWYEAVTNVHGWSDGDPFLVNYIGHPMQGAVSSYLWIQNDPAYRTAQFGRSPRYWKSRIRAAGFAWAYSAQFELGPLSEASLGKVQNFHPAQGFVDHIVTPSLGMAWTIGEDALDREIIQRLEQRWENPWARAFLRAGLNPSRSFANALRFKVPWHRDDRGWRSNFRPPRVSNDQPYTRSSASQPTFELSATATYSRLTDPDLPAADCIGSSATAALRTSPRTQFIARADGCKFFFTPRRISGDAMAFALGPRLALKTSGKVRPYLEALAGVQRITVDEAKDSPATPVWNAIRGWVPPPPGRSSPLAHTHQASGFLLSSTAGLDLTLRPSLALRLAELNYARTWLPQTEMAGYSNALRVSAGLIIRLGTW